MINCYLMQIWWRIHSVCQWSVLGLDSGAWQPREVSKPRDRYFKLSYRFEIDRHIGSTAAEVPVKFQSDQTILNTNLAASRLYEILRKDVFSDIETGPWALLLTLQWRHNERDGVSNHWHLDCLLKRLFRCRSKKTSKPRVASLCEGNHSWIPLTKGSVTRKMFGFDDVIVTWINFNHSMGK